MWPRTWGSNTVNVSTRDLQPHFNTYVSTYSQTWRVSYKKEERDVDVWLSSQIPFPTLHLFLKMSEIHPLA